MRLTTLLVASCLLLTNISLANDQPMPFPQETYDQYRCLAKGTGIIDPPYGCQFSFLVMYEANFNYLYFVFDYPLDPGQEDELDSYQNRFSLAWNIGHFELNGQNWSVVAMPITGEPRAMVGVFLGHLRKQSFVSDLRPLTLEL